MAPFLVGMPRTVKRMDARPTRAKARAFAAVTLLSLALLACGRTHRPSRPAPHADLAVARVDGATVWASDVEREAADDGLVTAGQRLDPSAPAFRQALEEVVDRKLLAADAVRRGLTNGVAAQRRLAAARERVLSDLMLESVVARTVNRQAVEGLYAEMLKHQAPSEEFAVRQIVLADQARANQVRSLLAAGAPFEALAAGQSLDEATRPGGGRMAPVALDGLPPAYAAALKDARPGEIVGPFKSDQGWVVARLDTRTPAPPPPLSEARPRIVRFLTYDQVKDLVLDLRRRAKIIVLAAPAAPTLAAKGKP